MDDLNEQEDPTSLEAFARALAREHEIVQPPRRGEARLHRRLRTLRDVHQSVATRFQRAGPDALLGATAEWFLDNQHLVLEALQQIEEDLSSEFYRELPRLKETGRRDEPRVFAIGRALVEEGEGHVDPERTERMLIAYQEVTPLAMGELWAVPPMLRLALVESLAVSGANLADVLFHDRSELEKIGWERKDIPVAEMVPGGFDSLRTIAATDWKRFFEAVSRVERALREGDPSGFYLRMDFETRDRYRKAVELIARTSDRGEEQVALEAVRKAGEAEPDAESRTRHVGHHLIGPGRPAFEETVGARVPVFLRVRRLLEGNALPFYLGSIAVGTAVALAILVIPLIAGEARLTSIAAALVLAIVPASGVAVALVNWTVTTLLPPRVLPKLEHRNGIPDGSRTAVVVPALLATEGDVDEVLEQVELNYRGNADPNLWFVLLTDFADAPEAVMPSDAPLLDRAKSGVESLNRRHGDGREGKEEFGPFLLFHRSRRWNPSEGCWMGWERKRGKLEEFNQLVLGKGIGDLEAVVGQPEDITGLRYVITLDADTFLPRATARRLVGAFDHPLNRPEVDPSGRLTSGYTVLQPRVETYPARARPTLFSRIFEADRGLDLYSRAVSDVYQDLFGTGIYVGKGIYDVAAFEGTLRDRIPENALLSHDLFEGVHGRAALATDVTLFEDFPDQVLSYLQRLHRWVRGDWQIARWLFSRVPSSSGEWVPNRIGALGRWMIFDNLRRSLLFPALLALVTVGVVFLPGPSWWWAAAALSALAVPVVLGSPVLFRLRATVSPGWAPVSRGTLLRATGASRWLVAVVLLPYRAYLEADAIVRTLVRVLVTKERLLEWTTQAEMARSIRSEANRRAYWARMGPAPLFAVGVGALAALVRPDALLVLGPLLLVWLASPSLAEWISRAPARRERKLSEEDIHRLRLLARRTWRYYEDLVGPDDHWLPPDHFQEDPRGEPAHRTSPTNIGLMLVSTLTAYDLGYLTPSELVARLDNTFDEMEKLERYRGHFLNWYQTRDLSPLLPRYVSVVDSGNLAGCLIALKEGLGELSRERLPRDRELDGMADTIRVVEEVLQSAASGRVLDDTGCTEALSALRAGIRTRGSGPGGLTELERWMETRGIPDLETAIGRLADTEGLRVDPGVLAQLRTWIVRLRQEISEVKRDRSGITPWHDLHTEAPEALEALASEAGMDRVYRELSSVSSERCRLGDVEHVCRRLRGLLQELAGGILGIRGSPEADRVLEWIDGFREALEKACSTAERLAEEALELRNRAETWLGEMDFSFLFRSDKKLFHIGFNVTAGQYDVGYYDLLASEARLASLLAIAKGEIEAEHWLHLGRPFGRPGRSAVLLSWAGTTFEYLMPFLLNRAPEGSLLALSAREAIDTHIRFGRHHGIPWGISESGYHELDTQGWYQYHAFGIPELAIRRDPGDRIVVSPYASVLALPFSPREVVQNLERLEALGMSGSYGLYEAVDFGFTPGLLRGSRSGRIVRSFMAHHQGMILQAIGNALDGNRMVKRFHRDPRIEAAEYLLFERAPGEVRLEPVPERLAVRPEERPTPSPVELWRVPDEFPRSQVQALSNGALNILVSRRGGGGIRWKGRAMTRWNPEAISSGAGTWVYLQDLSSGDLWSPTADPTRVELEDADVTFGPHEVEWSGVHDGIATRMGVAVPSAADVEVRRLQLRNQGDRRRRIRITSYGEPVLADPSEDRRHPAFNKLFVDARHQEDPPALIFRRRKASPTEPTLVLGHALAGTALDGVDVEWETDRGRFLGREGSYEAPEALVSGDPLEGREGATLDPVFCLSITIELDSGADTELLLLTAVGGSETDVRMALDSYRTPRRADLAFSQARARVRTRLQELGLSPEQTRCAQRILSTLLVPYHSGRQGPPASSDDAPCRRALWALAISGDLPILLVTVPDFEERATLLEAIRCHAWLRQMGVEVDLVVLDDTISGYATPLLDWLRRTLRRVTGSERIGRTGGVHYVPASQPTSAQRRALEGTASLHLRADAGTVEEQLERLGGRGARLPPFVPVPTTPLVEDETPPVERPEDLLFDNGLGGFSPDGREYVIHLEPGASTPAPWINVVATPEFGFTVSERGGGYTWALNSGEHRLTPWTNDPVLDTPGEAIYLRDEETAEVWSATPGPAPADAPYQVRHGAGYTRFLHRSHGLEQELVLFASRGEPVKVVELRVTNLSSRPRRLTATKYAEWVLGRDRGTEGPHLVTSWDPEAELLTVENRFSRPSGPPVGFLAADRPVHGWTADRQEFLGKGGRANPEGLGRIGLAEVAGAGLDPCGALQLHIDLKPAASTTVRFFLGATDAPARAREIVAGLREPGAADQRRADVDAFWNDLLGRFAVRTPDSALDVLLNRWAPYQTLSCRIWGRSALYQSSGAFGFRDQLQDVLAFLPTCPRLAREHILESARRQFEEGDVLHWWHPPHGQGVRSRCSDDLLWLPWAVASYVEATDDLEILEERVPFLEGPELSPGEMERYGEYGPGPVEGSLYEHCVRALDRGMTAGPHGLPLIGSGDWNDGMDRVGRAGAGESVWLGWFIIDTATRFAAISERTGDEDRSRTLRDRAESLRETLEDVAWDGEWYYRATYDDGTPLGSAGGAEDRIDSISQSWAVLSGGGSPDRVRTAMEAVRRRLVVDEEDLVLLLEPPFDATPRWPGYIKAYPPGIRENGGQYTHAATWVGWAFARLGDGGRAHEVFRILNPVDRALSAEELRTYRVEPYAVVADVGGAPPHRGRGGWTWYTGSAGWMVRLGREAILGFHPARGGFRIDPCIPPEWEEYEVTFRRGAASWRVRVLNPEGVARGVRTIEVDGAPTETRFLAMEDDGRAHEVRVLMGKPERESGARRRDDTQRLPRDAEG